MADTDQRAAYTEDYYRSLVEYQTDLICRYDHDLILLYVNRAYAEANGLRPEEMVGTCILDRIPVEDQARAIAHVKSLNAAHPVATSEHQSRIFNGERRWMQWTDQAIFDAAGNLIAYQGVGRDTTDRKLAELALSQFSETLELRVNERTAELKAAKEQVEAILDNSLDGILLVEADLRIRRSNSRFDSLVGLDSRAAEDRSLLEFIHPDDAPRVSALVEFTLAQQAGKHLDIRILRAGGGTRFDAEIGFGAIRNDGLVCTIRDISERKERKRQFQFHASLQQNVNDAVIATDTQFKITSWNRAAENIYGWRAEEVIGQHVTSVLKTEYNTGETTPEVAARFQESGHWAGEVTQRHKDGHSIHILCSTVLFKDEEDLPVGVVSVNQDITARKLSEQAQIASAEESRLFQTYLMALQEVTIELAQVDSLDDFYRLAVEWGRARFGFDRLGLILYNPKDRLAHGTYGTSADGQLTDERDVTFKPDAAGVMFQAFEQKERFAYAESVMLYTGNLEVGTGWHAAAVMWNGQQRLGWLSADNGIHHLPSSKPLLDILSLYALTIGSLLGRKRTEEDLRESEENFRTLLDSVPVATIITNKVGQITLVNDQAEVLFGYTRYELLGQSAGLLMPEYAGIWNETDPEAARESLDQLYALSGSEIFARRRDGKQIPVEIEVGNIQSKTSLLLMSFLDIAKRKQAEQALRASVEESRVFQSYLIKLQEITIDLTQIDTMDEFYLRAIEWGRSRFGFERLALFLYDPADGTANGTFGTDVNGIVTDERGIKITPAHDGLMFKAFQGSDRFAYAETINLFTGYQTVGVGWNAAAVLWNGSERLGWLTADNGIEHGPSTKSLLDILALYGLTIGTLLGRKQAEVALRESEARFRLLLDAAPVATLITNEAGNITLVNEQAEKLFGYTRADLLDQSVDLLLPEYARPTHAGHRANYIEAPRVRPSPPGLDLFARHKDGRNIPVEIELSFIQTKAGLLVMSFIVDITERKEAAAALEAQRRFLRQVIDVSPSMIFVKDYDANFILANPIFADMYKVTPDELIGRNDRDFNPSSEEVDNFLLADRKVIDSGEPYNIEEAVSNLSGETHWFQTTKVPIIGPDGKSRYVLGVATDITVTKRNEKMIREALEREKELGELKSRFVMMASHEFRTPLATILAVTESLGVYRHKMTSEQIDERLAKIREQIGHLRDIMEDVLHLARLQARRAEFNPAPLDIDLLCRSVIEELQAQPDSSHQVVYTCADDMREATLDKKLMRQIISNLVSNAMKYSPNDSTVTIRLESDAEAMILRVTDQGIGIPQADLKHLGEPFHRAANVGVISGTGLGLTIARESVELHGGKIDVESAVGAGTTFTITIPLMPQGAPA